MVKVAGIISKETDKAVYVAQVWASEDGFEWGHNGGEWLPKSQLQDLVTGERFPNHLSNGRTEWRREFSAEIPAWLARKILHVKTGPVPYAQRPW